MKNLINSPLNRYYYIISKFLTKLSFSFYLFFFFFVNKYDWKEWIYEGWVYEWMKGIFVYLLFVCAWEVNLARENNFISQRKEIK